jgi:dimethylargininase
MLLALTRPVPRSIESCELTHLDRQPIDLQRAAAQHDSYRSALEELGCTVEELPRLDDMPDSVFVEDTAVVLDELAIITRPGAASRRGETATMAEALGRRRTLVRIEAPATLDGGDVLTIGRQIFVGRSARTSAAGVAQLRDAVAPFGYSVESVALSGCLHLKSAATLIAPDTLLINPAWVEGALFGRLQTISVDPGEPFAANALVVGSIVLYPAAFPETAARMEKRGISLRSIDASELAKAEGGLTCCSILLSG